jgi:ribonucleotide reductase alpha subunit
MIEQGILPALSSSVLRQRNQIEKDEKMETATITAAEQFARDYLLIVENDQSTWNYIQEMKEEAGNAYALAIFLQDEFEEGATELIDGAKLSEVAQMLFRQMLLQWGIEPWLIIARDLWERS